MKIFLIIICIVIIISYLLISIFFKNENLHYVINFVEDSKNENKLCLNFESLCQTQIELFINRIFNDNSESIFNDNIITKEYIKSKNEISKLKIKLDEKDLNFIINNKKNNIINYLIGKKCICSEDKKKLLDYLV